MFDIDTDLYSLQELMVEYVDTLDDTENHEWHDTERGNEEVSLAHFWDWLITKTAAWQEVQEELLAAKDEVERLEIELLSYSFRSNLTKGGDKHIDTVA